MSGRTTTSRRPRASAREDDAAPRGGSPRRKRGPHIGPIGISPLRVTLFIALLGGLGFLAYAVFVRDTLQVPLMASGFAVKSWAYDLHEGYGCPERDVKEHAVTASALSADGLSIDVVVDGLEDVRVYELRCPAVRSANGMQAPWHPVAWYTRNRAPQ